MLSISFIMSSNVLFPEKYLNWTESSLFILAKNSSSLEQATLELISNGVRATR